MGGRAIFVAFFFALLVFPWSRATVAEVPVPQLRSRVTDLTGTLTADQQYKLDETLRNFEAKKGSQVAVLIVPTTAPETIEQYGIRVASTWKLGRQGVDDGVLLLIAKNDRAVRIEVGYGLEGPLPDAIAKRIIEEQILPEFRAGNFFEGVRAGAKGIIKVVSGEPLPKPKKNFGGDDADPVSFFVGSLVLGQFLQSIIGKGLAAGAAGLIGGIAVGYFTAPVIGLFAGIILALIVLGSSSLGGGYRRGYGSFGGRSSYGGGGFSGGGGSFGGGGASGRW